MEIHLWFFIVIIYLESERKFEIIINGVTNIRIMKMNNEKTCPSLILNIKHRNQEKTQKTKDNNTSVQNKSEFFFVIRIKY